MISGQRAHTVVILGQRVTPDKAQVSYTAEGIALAVDHTRLFYNESSATV